MRETVIDLINKEGWEIKDGRVLVYNRQFGVIHPCLIHLSLYKNEKNPDIRYTHLKAAHDYLWPQDIPTWHTWTEERFREHCHDWNYISWAGGASCGKAQPLTSNILTPYGWKKMGELRVGNLLCAPDGTTSTVTAIHPQGVKSIYKLSFSDGSSCEATGDHLWKVQSRKQRNRNQGKFHIYTTLQIKEFTQTALTFKRLSVPYITPVNFLNEPKLLIHPWLLGYYVANGTCSTPSSSASITCPTLELAEKIKNYWPDCIIEKHKNRNAYLVKLHGYRTLLRETYTSLFAKKSTEKAIPHDYIYNTENNRLALLQGLIDGDGHINKGATGADLQFSNKELAYQALNLARSLGYTVSINGPRKTHYIKNGVKINCKNAWRMYISARKDLKNFSTLKTTKASRNNYREIIKVEYVREDYAQCITVSHHSKLYITDDFIPTHNSVDSAKLGLLFWFAAPTKRGVIVASVTLESLNSRIFGYTTNYLKKRAIPIPAKYMGGNSPKILYPTERGEAKDTIHGIFAVAAKQGSDESAINTWIGRHPEDALLVILDECTDLNVAISKSFVNLDSSEKPFQCLAIGNSSSWFDLHGMLSYPKEGIDSVNPDIDTRWLTTQKRGLCLFFDCYNSPAIHEPDAYKRKLLSKFLITEEQIKEKEKQYGRDSESFYRFVRGYWKSKTVDNVLMSKPFLEVHNVEEKAEWSGIHPLVMVAGLDPAFSSGGDTCLLRLGVLGQDCTGKIVLDFKEDKYLYKLIINAKSRKAVEIQIAEQVVEVLDQFGIPINTLCIDSNGQGRALGGTIQLQANSLLVPTKIYSVRSGDVNTRSFDIKIMEAYELWNALRSFIENDQIRGLDKDSMLQLTNRLIITQDSKGKSIRPRLENKLEFKRRMGAIMPSLAHSPDEADSAALTLQSAVIHYGFHLGQKKELQIVRDFAHQKLAAFKSEMKMQMQNHEVHKEGLKSGFVNPVTDFHGIKFK